MIPIRLDEVARVTGGQIVDGASVDDLVVGDVVVDSRRVVPGGLFVCFAGERTDGHDFAANAIAAGAVAVLATRPVGAPAVVVDDALTALGALATASLARAPAVRVVGVTGSAGKTSTKDLIGRVFATSGDTVAPEGNYNNEYGLPLTVLRITADTRTLVLEYGARSAGHIAHLTRIARPSIAVVLNVGDAHLGEFGSRDMVAQAKGELVEALAPSGVAVLNADDALVAVMAARTAATVMTFGADRSADVRVDSCTLDELVRPRFRLVTPVGTADVALRLHGAHQALNAAAATAAGLAAGLDLSAIADALSTADAVSDHRMRLHEGEDGLLVIDDAYNASPDSMRAALRALAGLGAHGRRTWAVLGPMRELGAESEALHAQLGRDVVAAGIDNLVVVGPDAGAVLDAAQSSGDWTGEGTAVADVAEAVALLRVGMTTDDVVLVKASNSERLWRVAESLTSAVSAEARA